MTGAAAAFSGKRKLGTMGRLAELTYSGRIDGGVTNIRNPSSPHWRRSLQPGFRCLVPATPSADPTDLPGLDGKKVWTCFGLHDSRPLFALAGIWCDWTGTCRTLKDCDA